MDASHPLPLNEDDKPNILADLARMREVLEQHLRTGSGKRCQVLTCVLTTQHRRDQTRGSVQYELRVFDPESGQVWDQIVTGLSYGEERARRVWEIICSAGVSSIPSVVSPSLQPYVYVPELHLILQAFPHDHRLPALASLLAGPMAELVPALLADFGAGDWSLLNWDAHPVQYRVDKRAIVRLQVTARDERSGRQARREFYAKVDRDANQARQNYLAQLRLHELLAAAAKQVAVAKPVAFNAELRTIVARGVSGTSLAELIRQGDDPNPSLRLSARAIAHFHLLDFEAPPRPVANDVARLRDAEAVLRTRRPDLAPEISAIVEAVVNGLSDVPTSPIHGDLKPEHILIDNEHVTLLDFDLMAASDPMVDIARLIAFLGNSRDRSRRARGDGPSATRVFLDEYFRHVPESWRARLPIYHAMASIHKATSMSWKSGRDRKDFTLDILREAQSLLEEAATDGMSPSFKRRATRWQLDSR